MRIHKLRVALAAAALGVVALGAMPAFGADHRDAPLSKDAPKSDINDLYVFKGATSGDGYVALITVNPLTTPGDTARLSLDPATNYELKADTNGDAVADVSYKFQFTGAGPEQDVTVRRATGADAVTNDRSGTVFATGKTSSGSAINVIAGSGGQKVYVGPRDDPFFFDLAGFQNGLKFTGVDTFKGTNVTVIALEVTSVPSQTLGFWATTSKQDALGNWVQLDRMARPAINTVFIPAAKKDAFNNNTPDRDKAIFTVDVKAALDSLKSPATDALAGLLLPDILTVDLSKPVGYLNGRAPKDDVIDISLQAITGSTTIGDGVNANDNAFPTTFPYLAAPNGGGAGGSAPLPPNTGNGLQMDRSDLNWTLPIALVAAAGLLGLAGVAGRRKSEEQA